VPAQEEAELHPTKAAARAGIAATTRDVARDVRTLPDQRSSVARWLSLRQAAPTPLGLDDDRPRAFFLTVPRHATLDPTGSLSEPLPSPQPRCRRSALARIGGRRAASVVQASRFAAMSPCSAERQPRRANLAWSLHFGGIQRNACTYSRRLITRRSQVQILPSLLVKAPGTGPFPLKSWTPKTKLQACGRSRSRHSVGWS
jgi:hypothetical protein